MNVCHESEHPVARTEQYIYIYIYAFVSQWAVAQISVSQGRAVYRGIANIGQEPNWCRTNPESHTPRTPFFIPC